MVHHAEFEHYATRDEAMAAEIAQIKTLDPVYNIKDKPPAPELTKPEGIPSPVPPAPTPKAALLDFPELEGQGTDPRYRCGRCGRKSESQIVFCRRCRQALQRKTEGKPEVAA